MERDEVVRRDRRAGVVERPDGVVERKRLEAQRLGEPEPDVASIGALSSHSAPGAVELLGASRARERLERMKREAADMWIQRGQRRRPGDVPDPRPDVGQAAQQPQR